MAGKVWPGSGAGAQQPAGGSGAFHILYVEHHRMLVAYLASLVGDKHLAEDLAQETFLRVHGILDRYDESRPFAAWLRGIARNVARESYRVKHSSPLALSDDITVMIDNRFAALEQAPGDDFGERVGALRKCLDGLSDVLKRAVELYYADGLDCKTIASRLRSKVESVKKRLQRARKALADCMRREVEPQQ
ncbi:MAG TPA: RNA polymerase sigma factor [Planctomycetes bacterium]|nr:RNA polymerase sigma factor [Planctomycetota bacterium]